MATASQDNAVVRPSPGKLESVNPRVWARVSAYGLRIALGASSKEELDDLRSILPPKVRPLESSAVDVSYVVQPAIPSRDRTEPEAFIGYMDGEAILCFPDYRALLQSMERHLHLHVAEFAPRRVFIHAGVVAWNGQGVVIPGTSHSGKSTLVAALLSAGANYYSDEFAVVDPVGRIHPYPQPISLRDKYGIAERSDAAHFDARVGRRPLKARLIIVTRFREGSRSRLHAISPGEAMLALLANTVSARRNPSLALRSLNRMLTGASLVKGPRGEAKALVARLIRLGYLPR